MTDVHMMDPAQNYSGGGHAEIHVSELLTPQESERPVYSMSNGQLNIEMQFLCT